LCRRWQQAHTQACALPPHPPFQPTRQPFQAKTKELKSSFNEQFSAVHELCLMVLNASQRPDLIRATLSTLHAFLSWVPLGYIFESNVIEVLLRLFPQPAFRNISLQCLAEVSAEGAGGCESKG